MFNAIVMPKFGNKQHNNRMPCVDMTSMEPRISGSRKTYGRMKVSTQIITDNTTPRIGRDKGTEISMANRMKLTP